MAIILYIVLAALCAAILAEGLRQPERMYQFPFGAAAVFLGFIVMPLLGLYRTGAHLPEWALERYVLMCILCLSMCWLGDLSGRRHVVRVATRVPAWHHSRWLLEATILILVGGVAYVKYRALFAAEFEMNTGIVVVFRFFSLLLRYGFIMALLHFLRTRSMHALFLTCLAGMYHLDRVIFFAKRQDAVEFAFVVACSIWFASRRTVPRLVVVGGLVFGTLFLYNTGAYRTIVVSPSGDRDWSQLRDIHPVETVQVVIAEGASETTAGIYLTAATAAEMQFDFGLFHWNALVFNYVPTQVMGSAFKESLYLPVPNVVQTAEREFGYVKPYGSTVTGVVDCFGSFWYVGCLKFFAIAYIMQRLYRCGIRGNIIAQSIYLYMTTMALHSISHSTQWFSSPWIHMLIFWIPLMLCATQRGGIAQPNSGHYRIHPGFVRQRRIAHGCACSRGTVVPAHMPGQFSG